MRKKENHKRDLAQFFDEFLTTEDERAIIDYLLAHSNLPGRRGNLELAGAFAELAEDYYEKDIERVWNFCLKLTEVSAEEAPVNDPKEFLPFCGACALGAIGSVSPTLYRNALARLNALANDPRWRTREGVAMGIQKLVEREGEKTLKELESWIVTGKWLAMRAVAAGVAEPALLKDKHTAKQALELHKKIFDRILNGNERKGDAFKVLRKGLGYSLSVVVAAIPEEGFEYMRQLAESPDNHIRWILKENLKKNRLIKNYPDEVATIKELLK
jgi:hypothetical protein